MKKYICLAFLCALTLVLNAQQQDCVLWYKQPAKNWNEALPIGNGRLGAMIFGDTHNEIIQLNEESLWGGYKNDANANSAAMIPEIQKLLINEKIAEAAELSNKHMRSNPLRIRSYQTFGNIEINLLGKRHPQSLIKEYRRDLNIETGVASVSYKVGEQFIKRELFISAPDNVMVLRLSTDKPNGLTFRLHYNREQDARAYPISKTELGIEGQIIDLPEPDLGESGAHMKFAGKIVGEQKGGTMQTLNNAFFVENADEVVFYFTAATDYNIQKQNFDRTIDPSKLCSDILDAIKNSSYQEIKNKHLSEHRAMFNRVTFNIGEPSILPTDERLQKVKNGELDLSLISLYFQYGRYLLMSSSRAPGVLPSNLQGVWNKDINAIWNSDFHTNINIQMNYWPVELCNLSETFDPFSKLITSLREPGRVTASKTYNSKGWTVNHLTNPFGHTAISDAVAWGTFPIAASWLVLHQWEHYQFTNDRKYLEEEAYPAMMEAAEFILNFLVEDNNGYLVTAPSNSPENTYKLSDGSKFMLTYGSTMDIQIIRELFTACLKAQKILNLNDSSQKQLAQTLAKLPPVKISERYNTIQEWINDYEEVEPGHRHISHLFGLYPGNTITPSEKNLYEAARRTIARRRFYNENEETKQGTYTGWSRAWMINFYARLLDGEEAGDNVQKILAQTTLPNLFNTHPPFQIDGNFGATAGIAEMLLQSQNEELHLLPALPSAWKTGEMKGLRARGGYTIDLSWKDGKLLEAKITATQKGKVKVRYRNQTKTMSIAEGKTVVFTGH